MRLVRIRSLPAGSVFETALTDRLGVVTQRRDGGVEALLVPLSGDDLERKLLAPEVLVRFTGFESAWAADPRNGRPPKVRRALACV